MMLLKTYVDPAVKEIRVQAIANISWQNFIQTGGSCPWSLVQGVQCTQCWSWCEMFIWHCVPETVNKNKNNC